MQNIEQTPVIDVSRLAALYLKRLPSTNRLEQISIAGKTSGTEYSDRTWNQLRDFLKAFYSPNVTDQEIHDFGVAAWQLLKR